MKRYDFNWGYVGIEQREREDGDWVRFEDVEPALLQAKEALEWVIEQGGGPRCEHEAGVCFCKEVVALRSINDALVVGTPEDEK